MAGLLSPEDASLMALGTGLLGGGTFAQAFGRGGQAALSTYAAMAQAQQEKALKERELAMQEELRKAQIQDYLSQAAHRKSQDEAAATQQGTINSLYQRLASPQAPIGAASSVLQSGANAGSVGPTMANAANLPDLPIGEKLNIIDALAVAGAKNTDTLLKTLQYRNEPQKREAGAAYKNLVTGLVEYGPPKLPEFVRMGPTGSAELVPGGLDALGAIEGTKTRTTEAGKAAYDLVTVTKPDGTTVQMTRADAVAKAGGGSPSQNIGGAITPELRSFLEADAMREGVASPKINLTDPGRGNTWDRGAGVRQPGMRVQSESDKAAAVANAKLAPEAQALFNKDFMDRAYPAVMNAGESAGTVIESATIARDAMRKMGGTGWGTETKAAAANILTSLGVAPGNATMFASNAEVFQNQAMQRIQAELAQQKGVQAKDDAERAMKTWAQLKNTPGANEFILDYMQARAERDRVRAVFYRNALPIAQSKGDFGEVEREWSKRSPKLFELPSMQRWAN